jgi:hypothetical protein
LHDTDRMFNRRLSCHGDDDDDDAIRTAVGRPPSGQRRFLHFSP